MRPSSTSLDWPEKRLGEVARVYAGGTPLRSVPAFWGGSIPWVTTTEIDFGAIRRTHQTITELGLKSSAAKVAPAGTVLVAMYGQGKTRGKAAILSIPAAMNQACAAIETSSELSPSYLLQYLISKYESIRAMSNAGSQENLSGAIVKRIPILLPPPREQEAIATVLGDADVQIAALERLIAKKWAIKQGIMQQLLTGKTRLPGFAAPWVEVTLGNHVSYLTSVALSRAQLDETSPLKYLHYGDIHTRMAVTLDAVREALPRADASLAGRAGRLQSGDLVFADASEDQTGVGKSVEIVAVPPDGLVPGLHTIAARFDKSVLADDFKAYLQFIPSFRNALLRLAAGTKVLATTRSSISSITLPLPGVDEQRAIALVIADADRELSLLHDQLTKSRQIKQGMMQELLTGRTRLAAKEAVA